MKVIATEHAPAAIGPYSQGYITGNLVFTSGQIPIDPATGEIKSGIEEQAHQSCRNVLAILEAFGTEHKEQILEALRKAGYDPRVRRVNM